MQEGGKPAPARRLPSLGSDCEHELAYLVATASNVGLHLVEVHAVDPLDHSSSLLITNADDTDAGQRGTAALVDHAARTRRTVVIRKADVHDERARLLWADGYVSAVATPLWFDHRAAGAVIAASRTIEDLPPEVVTGVEMLALRLSGLFVHEAGDRRRHAQQETARLDQMKRDFVHTASHELRTPLTVIRTAAQTLDRKWGQLDDDTRNDLLRLLVANTGTLEQIFDRLLEADRAQTQLFAARREQIELTALSRSVVTRLAPLLEGHPITVGGHGQVWAIGDPVLIDRAIENLVSNAGRHTPAGTPIRLEVGVVDGAAQVVVADEGPGVPLDDLPSLGTAFFRGAHTATRAPRGLGLGLTVVARILDAHGTKLEIESVTGEGARFSFQLPLAEPRA